MSDRSEAVISPALPSLAGQTGTAYGVILAVERWKHENSVRGEKAALLEDLRQVRKES